MTSRVKILLIALGALILLAVVYYVFVKNNQGPTVTSDATPQSQAELTFINLAAQVDPIQFDFTVLNDPRFNQLHDIRTNVNTETTGRKDPFAPLAGVVGQ